MLELQVILVFMIIAAVMAMEIEDLLSSVIAMGAVGIGLTLEFLLLRAPDLAITQLMVEILSLIILIRATVGRDVCCPSKRGISWGYLVFAVLFLAVFLWFSCLGIRELPLFGAPVMKMGARYIAEAVSRTHATNIVAAIILDFRGYDTLGEATILFTSVIGVIAVLRTIGR